MGKRADTGAEGNLHATRNCHSSALFTQRLQAVFSAGGLGIARGVVAERIVVCSKLQVDAFLFHQVRSGFVEFDRMLDRVSTGFNAVPQPLATECMASSFLTVSMRFVHDSQNFLLRESRIAVQDAIRFELIVCGRMKLDPVCAVVDLLAHRLSRGPWSIHRLIISRQIYFRGAQDAFAGCHKPHGGHMHARPLTVPTVDRLLDVDIRVAAAMTHQIAQSRKARAKVFLRVGESKQGSIFARVVNRTGEGRSASLDAIESEPKY